MAKPTQQQIAALEKAHKEQLYLLAVAAELWHKLLKKVAGKPDYDPMRASFNKYSKELTALTTKWKLRQLNLEKAGVPVFPGLAKLNFFNPEQVKEIYSIVKFWDKTGKGIGFVPLLIWAGIALAGFLTAAFVTDEINDTAAEKATLIEKTNQAIADLGLSKQDAAKILGETTSAMNRPGLFDNLFSGTGLLVSAALIFMLLKK